MWPFKRKPLLDRDTSNWHLENFEWLVRSYADAKALTNARLVLPKPGFFPIGDETGHLKAAAILTKVKEYAQISDWHVVLTKGSTLAKPGRSLFEVQPTKQTLGTFQTQGNEIRITYSPSLVDDPETLIATLAHEIGHYIVAMAPEKAICADDELEFLTDLAAIYMGFGVFMANNAFQFAQWRDDAIGTQGWRMDRRGYLPEADLVFGLAIFLKAKDIDPADARVCLKPHLAKMLDRALRDLAERAEDIEKIRMIEREQVPKEA